MNRRNRFQSPNKYTRPSAPIAPQFRQPEYFKRGNPKKALWLCELCSPDRLMDARAVLVHEQTAEHTCKVDEIERSRAQWQNGDWGDWGQQQWQVPTTTTPEQQKSQEHRFFVDQLNDFIPFWIRGVEAAERGEVLKLEDFLAAKDAIALEGRGSRAGVAAHEACWPKERAVSSERQSLAAFYSSEGSDLTMPSEAFPVGGKARNIPTGRSEYDGHAFVEDIALQELVGEERRMEMHRFFEMSTQDKVRRIDELIRSLHIC